MLRRVESNNSLVRSQLFALLESEGELADGTHRSTLEVLTDWVQWADRTLVF